MISKFESFHDVLVAFAFGLLVVKLVGGRLAELYSDGGLACASMFIAGISASILKPGVVELLIFCDQRANEV